MEISNFEADVLETQVKWGKMHMIFVISISKLTETARSGEEVRKPCSCSLLVSCFTAIYCFHPNHDGMMV